MNDELKKYLLDILNAIESIDEYTGEKKLFLDYTKNKMLKRAVERELEIIGEALNNAMKQFPDLNIEHKKKIVQTRNFIIHAYDSINDEIIWSIVINHLPKLKEEVKSILEK